MFWHMKLIVSDALYLPKLNFSLYQYYYKIDKQYALEHSTQHYTWNLRVMDSTMQGYSTSTNESMYICKRLEIHIGDEACCVDILCPILYYRSNTQS